MSTEKEEVVGLRLLDGNEVIATKHPEMTGHSYSSMLKIVVHPSGQATMLPYVDLSAFDKKLKIKPEHIVLTYPATGAVRKQYDQFEEIMKKQQSKIIVPEKKIIT